MWATRLAMFWVLREKARPPLGETITFCRPVIFSISHVQLIPKYKTSEKVNLISAAEWGTSKESRTRAKLLRRENHLPFAVNDDLFANNFGRDLVTSQWWRRNFLPSVSRLTLGPDGTWNYRWLVDRELAKTKQLWINVVNNKQTFCKGIIIILKLTKKLRKKFAHVIIVFFAFSGCFDHVFPERNLVLFRSCQCSGCCNLLTLVFDRYFCFSYCYQCNNTSAQITIIIWVWCKVWVKK